jgi:thymidylate synthase (FAD)
MKVKLLSHTKDPEQMIAAAIRQCYAAVGPGELKRKIDKETRQRLIKQVLASGHTSTLEHASFTFGIEGVSRVSEIQLIRHRVGCSYSIQSGRYVKRGEAKFVIPVSVQNDKEILPKYKKILKEVQSLYNEMTDKGIKAEDARYLQPQSLQTKIVVTMNARALLHFFELRCCKRAQWEIQQMANLMLREVRKVAPIIFEKAGASCVTTGICWEGEKMSCGLYRDIKGAEVRTRI